MADRQTVGREASPRTYPPLSPLLLLLLRHTPCAITPTPPRLSYPPYHPHPHPYHPYPLPTPQPDAYDCDDMLFMRPWLKRFRVAAYINGHEHDQQLIKVRARGLCVCVSLCLCLCVCVCVVCVYVLCVLCVPPGGCNFARETHRASTPPRLAPAAP